MQFTNTAHHFKRCLSTVLLSPSSFILSIDLWPHGSHFGIKLASLPHLSKLSPNLPNWVRLAELLPQEICLHFNNNFSFMLYDFALSLFTIQVKISKKTWGRVILLKAFTVCLLRRRFFCVVLKNESNSWV